MQSRSCNRVTCERFSATSVAATRQRGCVTNVMPLLCACVERANAVLGHGGCVRIIIFRSADFACRNFKIQNKSSRRTAPCCVAAACWRVMWLGLPCVSAATGQHELHVPDMCSVFLCVLSAVLLASLQHTCTSNCPGTAATLFLNLSPSPPPPNPTHPLNSSTP